MYKDRFVANTDDKEFEEKIEKDVVLEDIIEIMIDKTNKSVEAEA